jgi:hypothetical protein
MSVREFLRRWTGMKPPAHGGVKPRSVAPGTIEPALPLPIGRARVALTKEIPCPERRAEGCLAARFSG